MKKLNPVFERFKQKAVMTACCASAAMMLAIPSFAVDDTTTAGSTLDPTLFDPLVNGVTSNISAVLPKVLVVVALLVGLGVVITLFKRHARPS